MNSTHLQMGHYVNIKRAYFDGEFLPAFETISRSINPTEKNYIIADKHVRLKCYTPHLAQFMTGALAHHPKPIGETPDITIHILDSVGTGMDISAPWQNPDYAQKLETKAGQSGDGSFSGVYWYDDTLNFFDRENKQAYLWTHDGANLANWVGGAPLRGILHWFLSSCGMQFMHGAVVGINGRGVLMSAKSGSGKSTTALSCLISGMQYVADDYAAIETTPDGLVAHNLFNSIKVLPHGFELFPELEKYPIWNREGYESGKDEKAMIFVDGTFSSPMMESLPIAAILIPKITGDETKIVPITKLAAMLALVPTTLFQLPLPSANTMSDFKKIIEGTECYTLELGPDIKGIPGVIKGFLMKD